MKLIVNGIRGGNCVRSITDALLEVDLGARINFNLQARLVRVEGRLTLNEATAAIERCGFEIVSIVDSTIADAVFRSERREVPPSRSSAEALARPSVESAVP